MCTSTFLIHLLRFIQRFIFMFRFKNNFFILYFARSTEHCLGTALSQSRKRIALIIFLIQSNQNKFTWAKFF